MMNTLNRRLLNASLVVSGLLLVPQIASAQDVTAMADNSSGFIGALVVWLLAVGGLLAVGAAIYSDRRAQATRTTSTTIRR